MKPDYIPYALKLFSYTALIGLLTLSHPLQGQTSWTAGNGDFTNGANWDNGAPGSTTAATISTTGTLTINLPSPDTIGSLLTTGTGTINLTLNANTLTMTGTGSPALSVDNGSTLTLSGTVGGGVTLTNGQLAIGDNSGNAGTLDLNSGTLAVGGTNGIAAGTGSSVINGAGGTIKVINSSLTTGIAMTLASNTYTTINTNGLDATFNGNITNTSANNGGLTKTGTGNLTLNGSANTISSFYVTGGNVNQGTGSLTVSELGVATGTGIVATYTMTGGTLTTTAGTPPAIVGASASSLRIGDFGGTGTFLQSGGTVNINGALNVGNQGGTGTYALSGGTLNVESGFTTLGRTNNTTGGSVGNFNLSGTGVMNIDGTAAFVLSNWYPTSGPIVQGTGTFTQTGGTITVANTASLILTGNGNGTYNLNGGTLQVGGNSLQGVYFGESGAYAFNLGGGTIQVKDSNLTTNVNATLTASATSTINTNGLNATLNGTLSGAGALLKTGGGQLILTQANSYSGGTSVSAGSLIVNNTTGSATGSGTLTVASGATLGGTGRVAPSSFNINGTVQAGNGIDTTSSLTLSNSGTSTFTNATLKFNLGSVAGQSNELYLGTGTVDFSNTTVSLTINSTPPLGSLFTLIDNGTLTDTYTGLTLGGTDTHGYMIITGGLTLGTQNGEYLFLNGGIIGVSIPEPGTVTLVLGGLGILYLFRRKIGSTATR